MSKLMYHPDGGFHHFYDEEMADAIKSGWINGDHVRASMLAKKRNPVKVEPVAVVSEPDTIEIPVLKRMGRPPKGSSSSK